MIRTAAVLGPNKLHLTTNSIVLDQANYPLLGRRGYQSRRKSDEHTGSVLVCGKCVPHVVRSTLRKRASPQHSRIGLLFC